MYRFVITNNLALLFQYVVGGIVPLLVTPLIVRAIGLSTFGEIAIELSWAGYSGMVCQYAFHLTGPTQVSQLRDGSTPGSVLLDVIGARLLLLAFISLPGLSVILMWGRGAGFFDTFLFLLFPIGSALNCGWLLQATGKFRAYSLASACATIGALIVGLALLDGSTQYAKQVSIVVLVVPNFLSGILSLILAARSVNLRLQSVRFAKCFSQLRDGVAVFLSQLFASIYGSLGPIIIGAIKDSSAAGTYSALERLVTAMTAGCLLIHTAAYPTLANLYVTNRQKYWRMMLFVVSVYLAVAVAVTTASLMLAPWIEIWFFGKTSEEYSVILRVGLCLVLLGIFGTALTGFYLVSGRQSRILPLTIGVSIVTVGLGYFGVRSFGSWGWLAASVAGQCIVLTVALVEVRKEVGGVEVKR